MASFCPKKIVQATENQTNRIRNEMRTQNDLITNFTVRFNV